MRHSLTGPNGSNRSPSSYTSMLEPLEGRRLLSSAPPYAHATDNDIVYGSDGSLHVAWYNSQAGSLNYASRSAAGAWSSAVTVDSIPGLPANTAGVGQYVTLALDSQNRPAVAYSDAYNGDLKFASRATGAWVVGPNIESTMALYPSLVFNGGDAPVLSYYYQATRDLKYARWTGSSWAKQGLDLTDDVGRSSSIHRIPGSIDRIGIAYEKTTDGDFKYVEVNTSGNWAFATVDTAPEAGGGFTSLAFDSNNNPAFSYYDSWTSTLMYASRSSAGAWSTQGISGRISHWSNLWFNPSDGSGHLVYYDVSGNLINHLTKTPTGNWNGANAEMRLGSGNYVSAAFKSDGTIAFTHGSPYADAVPSLGVGVLAGNLMQQPSIPTNGVTVVSNARIDLAWTYTGSANSGFKIGVSTDGGKTFAAEQVVASASARSAQITGLSGATTYSFAVRAYNATGDSTFSNVRGATTLIDPPAAPTVSAATVVSSSQIDLAWTDVAGETGYTLERSLTGTDGWSLVAALGANVTSYSNTGLDVNTTYHYRIRASNTTGNSANAAFDPATTRLATPTLTATNASSTRIDLAWSAVGGATGYTVQRLDGATYADVEAVGGTVTSYAVTGLTAATSYTFRVLATGANGNVSAPATASATTQQQQQQQQVIPEGSPLSVIRDPGAVSGEGFGQAFATRAGMILAGNGWANGGLGGAVLIDATTGNVMRRFANPSPTPDGTDGFGFAVAFVGNRIAISAPDDDDGVTGRVYIYDDFSDDVPDRVIEGPAVNYAIGNNGFAEGTGFGRVLAAWGDDLVLQYVGGNGGYGEVRRYDLATGALQQTYVGANAGMQFGNAIAVDHAAGRLLISSIGGGSTVSTIVSELDGATGSSLREFAISGASGVSLAYSADRFFVGAYHLDLVYAYDRSDASASPTPAHTYSGVAGTTFGLGLAVSGNQLLITAPGEQTLVYENELAVGVRNGAAYAYDMTTHALVRRIENPAVDYTSEPGMADQFGETAGVFADGTFAIGNTTADDDTSVDVGAVYTYGV